MTLARASLQHDLDFLEIQQILTDRGHLPNNQDLNEEQIQLVENELQSKKQKEQQRHDKAVGSIHPIYSDHPHDTTLRYWNQSRRTIGSGKTWLMPGGPGEHLLIVLSGGAAYAGRARGPIKTGPAWTGQSSFTPKVFASNKGLGANPFKGMTPQEIDRLLTSRGFIKVGPDPMNGKGSYLHPISGRKYYVDPGGTYKAGKELPHVDVHRKLDGKNIEGIKRKYPLGDKLYE